MDDDIKSFYGTYADQITAKRADSPYALRKYVHTVQYESMLAHITPGMKVLDAGCGEGTLSILMAKKGAIVTGCDISEPNIIAAKEFAAKEHVTVDFAVADLEHLPYVDNQFDMVVSSHVLEHLPDFDKGLLEIARVAQKRFVIAIPTALSACSLVQVGRGWFYLKGPRSFLALLWGTLRTLGAFITNKEGVDEGYVGKGLPHVFRFPWILKKKLRTYKLKLISYEADSLCIPYFASLIPLLTWLNARKANWFLRDMGYGTLYVIEKYVTRPE
jgi:SAM-dependent methyltransferase